MAENILSNGFSVELIFSTMQSMWWKTCRNVSCQSSWSTSHHPRIPSMRVPKRCTRCALKRVHMCIVFLEEVTGIQKTERISHTQLYKVIFAELITSALPGQVLKQAPRLFVSILVALGKFVVQSEIHNLPPSPLRFQTTVAPNRPWSESKEVHSRLAWSKTAGHDNLREITASCRRPLLSNQKLDG